MSSQKLIIVCLLVCMCAGCTILNPYIDRRRNPGVPDLNMLYSGPSKADKPVVCYNPLWSSDEELQQLADAECQKNETGDKAEFITKTYLDGKLLLPNHAHYTCIKN